MNILGKKMEEIVLKIAEKIIRGEPLEIDLSKFDAESMIREGIYRYFESCTKQYNINRSCWVDKFLARKDIHEEILEEIKSKYCDWEPKVQDAFFQHPLYCRITDDRQRKILHLVAILMRNCANDSSCGEEIAQFDIDIFDKVLNLFPFWELYKPIDNACANTILKRLKFLISMTEDETVPYNLRAIIHLDEIYRCISWLELLKTSN